MTRALAVAATLALVASVAVTLGLSAALDITWDAEAAVLQAVAAVWIGQYLLVAYLLSRKGRRQ